MEKPIREIRIDPINPNNKVVIATARSLRPKKKEEPIQFDKRDHVDTCPFCVGNEDKTPQEINIWKLKDTGWNVRLVENLYPILDDSPLESVSDVVLLDGYGRHEVFIDNDTHGRFLSEMDISEIDLIFQAYVERAKQLYLSDPALKYVLIFKNFGQSAGGSIPHTHSQLIAMPMVPDIIADECSNSLNYYKETSCCVFCDSIDVNKEFAVSVLDHKVGNVVRKIDVNKYVIEKNEHFVAIKPFASKYEWEIHVLPLKHESDFTNITNDERKDLAKLFKNVFLRLESQVPSLQYNYYIHSTPNNGSEFDDSFHWHIEICPRTSIQAGFELGSGAFVNSVSPELAAEKLRGAIS